MWSQSSHTCNLKRPQCGRSLAALKRPKTTTRREMWEPSRNPTRHRLARNRGGVHAQPQRRQNPENPNTRTPGRGTFALDVHVSPMRIRPTCPRGPDENQTHMSGSRKTPDPDCRLRRKTLMLINKEAPPPPPHPYSVPRPPHFVSSSRAPASHRPLKARPHPHPPPSLPLDRPPPPVGPGTHNDET